MSESLHECAAERQILTLKDVSAPTFISEYAKHLKKSGKMEIPKWFEYCKTSVAREMSPLDPDWMYYRAAALARRIYIRGGTGVKSFRKAFGGRQRRGGMPNTFCYASGKVIRHILKQLEKMGVVATDAKGGRKITKEGQRELDTIALQCSK